MPINPEIAMRVGNDINSVRGQIEKWRVEYSRVKNDPRHKRRAEELRLKISQAEKAERRHWDQINTEM